MTMNAVLSMVVFAVLLGTALCGTADSDSSQGSSSNLAKFVAAMSQPGAFNQTSALLGPEAPTPTPCPSGREGLSCRRREARRGVESCPNGACNACDMCAGAESIVVWPNCCKHSGVCCHRLARACQTCDQPPLLDFCRRHFKRCY